MCGIAGILNRNGKPVSEGLLRAMCQKMLHRGPDDEGIYISIKGAETCSVGLGHRRLSIIDLSSGGHQPMSNENGTIWLVINGEIYNYKDLRGELERKCHRFKSNTDSEVVLHLYEDYGKDCVKYLSGMFAFAIWDENKGELLLARDRVGKKPLVYSLQNGVFSFASELSALVSSGINREIKFEAIHHYLTFGYIPPPLSIYRNVFKLPPASIMVIKNNLTPVIDNYWKPDYTKKIKISEEEATEETLSLLKNAVKLRLRSDVPLGAFLSGGIDSSAIVGIMAELSSNKIKTFSIGFSDSDYNELNYARVVAKKFETDHHEFIVEPKALEILPILVERYGEPYADSSAIPTYYVSEQTKKFVTVALNGDGGDELFAGYERYQAVLISEIYNKIPASIRLGLINKLTALLPDSTNPKNRLRRIKRFLNGASYPLAQRYLQWVGVFTEPLKKSLYTEEFARKTNGYDSVQFINKYLNSNKSTNLIDRLLLTDMSTYLPGDLLTKVDIASMANSLEARSPFLDHKLIEFAASLPHKYKIMGFERKYILKKAVSKMLHREIIYRRKMGFGVPVGSWLREDLKGFLRDTLLSSASLSRGYFKPEVIKILVEDHIKGAQDYSFQLWALLMLELWHLKFIDKSM